MLTGHCAYTLGCERWRQACGECPHLDVFPPLRRDGTRGNLARKREIHRDLQATVVTPSRWLMERARTSALSAAIRDSEVIPNAVDLDVFSPGDQREARRLLGWPQDAQILLFTAAGGAGNRFKDVDTVRKAIGRLVQADHGRRARRSSCSWARPGR